MPFVLDASTALALVLTDEDATPSSSAVADALLGGDTALVPSLWLLEVANALLTSERRERLKPGSGDLLMQKLLSLPIKVASEAFGSGQRAVQTMAMARSGQLTAYDAAYLWLARSQGIPLATNDKALAVAAHGSSVELLVDLQ